MEDFDAHLRGSLKEKVTLASNLVQTYRDEFAELKNKQDKLMDELDQLEEREKKLVAEIETFRKDADYAKTKLETFQWRKQQLESQRATLLEESRELDRMLAGKEQELKQQREKLRKQRQRDNPEVKLYERLLGLQIDASQPGTLHFKFQNFDDKRMCRSCDLTLDVSGDNFTILSSNPELDKTVEEPELTDILNKCSDISRFLCASRTKLIACVDRIK